MPPEQAGKREIQAAFGGPNRHELLTIALSHRFSEFKISFAPKVAAGLTEGVSNGNASMLLKEVSP